MTTLRRRSTPPRIALVLLALLLVLPGLSLAQQSPDADGLHSATSELRDLVARYSTDRSALMRRWDVAWSATRRDRMRAFYEEWQDRLEDIDTADLSVEGAIDYVLFHNELRYRFKRLDREAAEFEEMADLLPFGARIAALEEARRAGEPIEPARAAELLDELTEELEQRQSSLVAARTRPESGEAKPGPAAPEPAGPERSAALRAVHATEALGEALDDWYEFHAGYDPLFTWWVEQPYERASEVIVAYRKYLRETVVGLAPEGGEEGDSEDPIIGDPIGAAGLAADLEHEMLAYDARDLIEIAEREYAWCVDQLQQASAELGYGDDWQAALTHVKSLHLEPGEQPELVRELALEAIAFVEERDLVTVPELAEEIWRMEMLSPESQRTAPFFLGGEVVRVAFPTEGMSHEEKLMSLRSNNVPFSRAVVHHELIPGHHLQGFMTARYNTHRRAFSTPFWGEGWPLYWEMLLWDLGFPRTPEEKIGMLFWRTHRAARIVFSLKFHLGEMSAEEAIEFLVEGVGHERSAATAEVRRSFAGSYPPLYQAAYMIGGLQIRTLHEEMVGTGRMTDREFHDAILQGGSMPIEMHRARLQGVAPEWEFRPRWRFADR
ncbi:MAG: DUF885 domain-containing protein [marine benthic group bacterium]|nr:DUF885 domain-containing protein [Candidatus Carthagonibacter metallireducens]MCL7975963.1 DUF885 domain-containing protein [Gemmatimonadota bacterium]